MKTRDSAIVEGGESEIDAALEECRGLGTEVVIGRIPEHLDAIGLGEASVVELDLHVDDVGDTGADHLDHFVIVPDAAANSDAVGHPRHVHAMVAP